MLIFRSEANSQKWKKIVFIKEKTVLSSKIKCTKSGIFTNNTGCGESGKAILQVSIAAVFRRYQKKIWPKMACPREKKLARTPVTLSPSLPVQSTGNHSLISIYCWEWLHYTFSHCKSPYIQVDSHVSVKSDHGYTKELISFNNSNRLSFASLSSLLPSTVAIFSCSPASELACSTLSVILAGQLQSVELIFLEVES